MRTIKCVAKYPGAPPEIVELTDCLKSYQGFVQGYIEACTFAPNWCVLCNEEGRIRGMEYNCEVLGVDFCGPILFVGVKDGDFCDFLQGGATLQDFSKAFPELWEEE